MFNHILFILMVECNTSSGGGGGGGTITTPGCIVWTVLPSSHPFLKLSNKYSNRTINKASHNPFCFAIAIIVTKDCKCQYVVPSEGFFGWIIWRWASIKPSHSDDLPILKDTPRVYEITTNAEQRDTGTSSALIVGLWTQRLFFDGFNMANPARVLRQSTYRLHSHSMTTRTNVNAMYRSRPIE